MAHQKSLGLAYILWSIGGLWGLHHIYLGRYRHAFLWITTLGGFCGLGWIRDIWRLPQYVAESNAQTHYVEEYVETMKQHWRPALTMSRLVAESMYGTIVGVVIVAGLPQDVIQGLLGTAISVALVPLGTGLAVHLVANIGREKAELKYALGGAYIMSVFAAGIDNPLSAITQSTLSATVLTNWKGKSWRRTKYKKFSKELCFGLLIGLFAYNALCFSTLYHNAYITTNDGESVPLRDALSNMMESHAWQHPIDTFSYIWNTYFSKGFYQSWREFVQAVDPEGEQLAYQILGVKPGASEKELRAAHKALVKKYHPDRASNPEERRERQQQFIMIQKAFETLSTISNRRARANRMDRSDKETRKL